MPEVTIRMHTSDKPWITQKIKAQIKARKKAYCRGDKSKYDQLCKKVSKLIRNAKQSFYHTEGRDLRQKDPAKWYKTVYTLLGAETNHNSLQTPSNEDLSKVAENLQTAFTNPWKDINVDLPDINEVNHLLKDTPPPLPSLGQVRSCLKHLNPKKATGIDKIPAWFLKHYCDDCTLDEVVANGALSNMQESTNQVMNWANDNKMMVNPKKTKDMWISFSQSSSEPPPIQTDGIEIERVNSFKLLGVWVQNDLKWNTHVCKITKRANKLLFLLRECRKSFLPPEIGLLTYTSKIRPILEYASPVWGGIPKYLEAEIERVQQRSLRILGFEKDTLPTLKERRDKATCNGLKRIVEVQKNPCNRFLSGNKNHTYELRRTRDSTPRQLSKTHRHSTSFIPRACRLTNS
ncbi:Hypothetical predicted protein [Paramuricea clavata]|uniref:Uncharacterized protein n=1 Tax=Paramuricea clavata TaxID=317549 RepID=A0A7D9J3K6_PARCT|nr:Hypothetical predicted protein [Paramuricea clavata]